VKQAFADVDPGGLWPRLVRLALSNTITHHSLKFEYAVRLGVGRGGVGGGNILSRRTTGLKLKERDVETVQKGSELGEVISKKRGVTLGRSVWLDPNKRGEK